MELSRRKFLVGISLAVLGVWFLDGPIRTTDITLSNETAKTVTAQIRVTKLSDDTPLLEDTATIDGNGTEEYEEIVNGSQVEIHVTVEDGPEKTKEWSDGESDATGLYIEIHDDSIEFQGFIV